MISLIRNAWRGVLNRSVSRGALWTVLGFGVSQAVRLGSSLILTRLLFPEAFGLMALVTVFVVGLELLSDAGIKQFIIRHPRAQEQRFLHTAWTIQVYRGCALFVCALMLAYPASLAYGQWQLAYMIPIAALSLLISGFTSVSIPLAMRQLHLGGVTALNLGASLAGTFLTITATWVWPTVWSLLVGGLVTAAVTVIGSFVLWRDYRPNLVFDREVAKELFRFGKWIVMSTALGFAASQLDRLMIGALATMAFLGSYAIADQLSRLPRMVTEQLAGSVCFPAFSQAHRDSDASVRAAHDIAQRWLDFFVFGSTALAALGPLIITMLFDPRYADAGWMLQALGVKSALACSARAASNCLVASGRPHYNTIEQGFNGVSTPLFILAGWSAFGAQGVIWGIVFAEIPALVWLQYGLIKSGYFRRTVIVRSAIAGMLGYGFGLLTDSIIIFVLEWVF
ncbi:MAG TPA: oligosaccharide flippase family protein [Hydrogenophaga sp.]|uniref:oligosaccharide flippase family protein n=1 Tax=Hydrogenophaga sp. TaxID=1904254 RepID=UPI002C99608E|nr:oligosaccharide flippase family protein [Hydrogenophaga sp.]HMN92006.1 oligosaccharide flippase family protein [Hydrogenophaga sp.]HMP08808.1 oligosaccharide flippase family protein [Hydrogenophaga sp.]